MKTKGTTKKIAEITMAAIPMIRPPVLRLRRLSELVVVPVVVVVVVMVAIRIHLLD